MKKKTLLVLLILGLTATTAYALNSLLKRDSFGVSIQGALRPAVAQKLNYYTTTDNAVNATAFTYPIIQITASTNCFFKLGTDNTVVATTSDHYLPANNPTWAKLDNNVYIAALAAVDNGVLYISELQ